MAAERPSAAFAAALLAAWAGTASATVATGEPPTVSKPSRPVAAKQAPPTHAWHEGGARRALRLDPSLEADFSPRPDASAGPLQRAGLAPKSAAPMVSPVFRDDAGRLRALPGGALVVLHGPLPEPEARALIAAAGATPSRALSPTLWVVEAPAGLASLELANRLHASGAFAAAQPNWWVARTLK